MILRGKYNGAKMYTEALDSSLLSGRRAFHSALKRTGKERGAYGSEHAGMSNDKSSENPVRRKPKVSYAMFVIVGLVGP